MFTDKEFIPNSADFANLFISIGKLMEKAKEPIPVNSDISSNTDTNTNSVVIKKAEELVLERS